MADQPTDPAATDAADPAVTAPTDPSVATDPDAPEGDIPAADPTNPAPGDGVHAEDGLANVAPDTPQPDEREVLTSPEQARQNVEDANAQAQPGQTVVHTTAGDAIVTGTPRPESTTNVDGQAVPNHDVELLESGQTRGIKTPLGYVLVSYERDSTGNVDMVTVTTIVDNPDFQQVSDAILLRSQAT